MVSNCQHSDSERSASSVLSVLSFLTILDIQNILEVLTILTRHGMPTCRDMPRVPCHAMSCGARMICPSIAWHHVSRLGMSWTLGAPRMMKNSWWRPTKKMKCSKQVPDTSPSAGGMSRQSVLRLTWDGKVIKWFSFEACNHASYLQDPFGWSRANSSRPSVQNADVSAPAWGKVVAHPPSSPNFTESYPVDLASVLRIICPQSFFTFSNEHVKFTKTSLFPEMLSESFLEFFRNLLIFWGPTAHITISHTTHHHTTMSHVICISDNLTIYMRF